MAVAGRLVQNRKETAQREKQYTKYYQKKKHRIHKIENKKQTHLTVTCISEPERLRICVA